MPVGVTPTLLGGYLYEEIDGVLYPYAEEYPVVQGNWHFTAVRDLLNMAEFLLRGQPRAGIFGDLFVFYEEGNPNAATAPDLLVLPEVADPKARRQSLRLWEEPTRPIFVLEALSDTTMSIDITAKFELYQSVIRIPEYFICDPREDPTEVAGYRLLEGRYELIPPDDAGRVWSAELHAWFGVNEEGRIQIWDATGQAMPRYREMVEITEDVARRAEEEARRAEEETRRADTAEARVRALEEELRRLRGRG